MIFETCAVILLIAVGIFTIGILSISEGMENNDCARFARFVCGK